MATSVMHGSSPATVLLLGNYRPTIVLARSLGSLGHRVIVGLGGGEGGAEHSRFSSEVWDHPPLEQPRPFLTSLRTFLEGRPDIGVLLPVAEAFVRVLATHRSDLPSDRLFAMPDPRVVATALDKMASYALAEAAGLPVAPRARVKSLPELHSQSGRIGFPLVIRPTDSTRPLGPYKALVARSSEELAELLPAWPAGHGDLLVQAKVSGRRHNLYFAAQAGRPVRMLEAIIDRTDRPDGTGLAVEGRTVALEPDLAAYTEALTRALGYTGVGCAQFLVDRERGSVYFLEINPRIAGNHAVAEAAGLGLGALSITLPDPSAPEVPFVAGRAGLVYAWTYGDLRALKTAWATGGLTPREAARRLRRIAATALAADVHMTWRWDDPLPTLILLARQIPGLSRLTGARAVASTARVDAPNAGVTP